MKPDPGYEYYCAGCSKSSGGNGKLTHEKWCEADYNQVVQIKIHKKECKKDE